MDTPRRQIAAQRIHGLPSTLKCDTVTGFFPEVTHRNHRTIRHIQCLTKKGLVPRGAAAQASVELNPSGSGEGWVFNRCQAFERGGRAGVSGRGRGRSWCRGGARGAQRRAGGAPGTGKERRREDRGTWNSAGELHRSLMTLSFPGDRRYPSTCQERWLSKRPRRLRGTLAAGFAKSAGHVLVKDARDQCLVGDALLQRPLLKGVQVLG